MTSGDGENDVEMLKAYKNSFAMKSEKKLAKNQQNILLTELEI
ncbi:HAD hydrolase family protein [Spiroplasma taiwanense]|nr:HAD hydrolase family protein [Spiroplasma taiwanense]